MRDIITDVKRWQEAGKTGIALATIVETRGSSLRPAGARMAITAEGDVAGSVSSGCVDSDVVAEMEFVLQGREAIRRPNFGITDEQAWSAGLACGGAIDLLVERWDPLHGRLLEEIEARRPVAFVSRIDTTKSAVHLLHTAEGATHGTLGDPDLDGEVLMDIASVWPGPYAQKHAYPQGEFFIEVIAPPPTLVIFGATDVGVALAALARVLDYEVIVSDARRAFLREERFPGAETRFGWPQDVFKSQDFGVSHAVIVLFHDAKFDVPALKLALRSEAFYIGFLGSRKTQADRRDSLFEAGFTEQDWARVHGPIGLDIGGKEPPLIALSILAEIVAVRHRRAGGMMSKR
jgi:xanthine dehydrogenase accessory factor